MNIQKELSMSLCLVNGMVSKEEVLVKYKTSERKQLRVMIPKDVFEDITDNIPEEWKYDPAARAMEVTRLLLLAKECEEKKAKNSE